MRRTWAVTGHYGYYSVDEYHPDSDHPAVTRGRVDDFRTRKQAETVAAALNTAFGHGVSYGAQYVTHTSKQAS